MQLNSTIMKINATHPHYVWWNVAATNITPAPNYSVLNKHGYFPFHYFCYFFLLQCKADSSSGATLPWGSSGTTESTKLGMP